MKILFVTDGIHPLVVGGMQKHSTLLVKHLAKHGVLIDLVHIGSQDDIKSVPELENLPELSLYEIKFPVSDSLPGHYVRSNKKYSKIVYNQFKEKISKETYDLIYTQGFVGYAFVKKSSEFLTPVLVNLHGLEMFQESPSAKVNLANKLLKPIAKYLLKNADIVSSFGGEILKITKQYRQDKDTWILPNGIELLDETKHIKSCNDKIKFCFIGRYERRKGIEELNIAISKLENVDFDFVFIGPIPDDKKLKDPRLNYLGQINSFDKIKETLASVDVIVCPSKSEGMPTVILEGMSQFCAILATKVGAVEDMIDGNGILLENNSPNTIKESLTKFIEMKRSDLDFMKKRSVEIVYNQYNWNIISSKLIDKINLKNS